VILVDSINGHIKPEPGRVKITAAPSGSFFCVVWGPIEHAPAQTVLEVYYTADFGRELFRVELPATENTRPLWRSIVVPKQEKQGRKWWAKLTIRKKKKAD
jgi:hypothetical protein